MGSKPSSFQLTSAGRVRLYSLEELIALPPPTWLIEAIIPSGGMVGLYGQPGSCKSFIAVDMAMSVASGKRWQGHEVDQGLVVYVSAEGGTGIGKRARVWCEHHAISPAQVNIAWIIEPIAINPSSPEVDKLFERIEDEVREPPALVIIDTLARCFEGDENQQEDMGAFVAGVDSLRHKFETTVMIVHHTRLDGDRERGNTAFRGAADTMIAVKREKGRHGIVHVENTKQKDVEEFAPRAFQLLPIEHEDPLQASCVVQAVVGSGAGAQLVQALRDKGVPSGTWHSGTELLALVDMSKSTFYRGLKEARKGQLLLVEGGHYALP